MSNKVIIIIVLSVILCLVGITSAEINACGFPTDIEGFPPCYLTFPPTVIDTPSAEPTPMPVLEPVEDIGNTNRILIDDQIINDVNYESPILINPIVDTQKTTQIRFEESGGTTITKTIQIFSESIIFDKNKDDISFIQSLPIESTSRSAFIQTKSEITLAKSESEVITKSLSAPISGKMTIQPTGRQTIRPTTIPTIEPDVTPGLFTNNRDECGFILGDPYAQPCNLNSNTAATVDAILIDEAYYGYQKSRTEPWDTYWRVVDTIDGKVLIYSDFATKQVTIKPITDTDYNAYIRNVVAENAVPDKESVRELVL